jgi:hypothetical protein
MEAVYRYHVYHGSTIIGRVVAHTKYHAYQKAIVKYPDMDIHVKRFKS